MVKKTITYTDYFGNERTEDFYFNLNEAELAEMALSVEGGMDAYLKKIAAANDHPTLVKLFKDILLRSYGEKSADGRRFIKSPEISTGFSQTEAYNILFMELASDAKVASEFINGIVPQKALQATKEE